MRIQSKSPNRKNRHGCFPLSKSSPPMPTTEPTINDALAELLRHTRHSWRMDGVINSENTGMIQGSKKKPDILIAEQHVSPVVIETEILPATTVEQDARSRLGERLAATGREILSSI